MHNGSMILNDVIVHFITVKMIRILLWKCFLTGKTWGNVISDNTPVVRSLETKFDKDGNVLENKEIKKDTLEGLTFDKNGFVIEAKKETKPKEEYMFDENGFVISPAKEEKPKEEVKDEIMFDENGFVISTKKAESKAEVKNETPSWYDEFDGELFG